MIRFPLKTLALTVAAAGMSGCAVVSDLVNPDALTALGFDPATIVSTQGKSVIVFSNMSSTPAYFVATVSDDPANPVSEVEPLIVGLVDAGETRNSVLDCPIGVITPGNATATFTSTGGAALVIVGEGLVEIPYGGSGLRSGTDFLCGDLIEIRLTEAGGAFNIEVRVLPGR